MASMFEQRELERLELEHDLEAPLRRVAPQLADGLYSPPPLRLGQG